MWILFVILLEVDRYYVAPQDVFPTMASCFEARDFFMATAPKPKVNYDAICIMTDHEIGGV